MNSLEPILISGFRYGKQTNKKPFLLIDGAFKELYNAYIFRETLKKREGTRLIGRLRRSLTNQSSGNIEAIGAGTFQFDLKTALSLETNAEIESGDKTNITITIAAPISQTLTDTLGTGVLTVSAGVITQASINYTTGILTAVFSGAALASASTFTGAYYPALPVMGITLRETSDLNDEQSILYDQKYAYAYNGSNFLEYASATPTTWDAQDYEFFWYTNYRGSDASSRIYFVTNNGDAATNPPRYFDNVDWFNFTPYISGINISNESKGNAIGAAFGPAFLTQSPVIPGTVTIRVGSITFRDTNSNGIFVTSGLNSGTINYENGEINLVFNPALGVATEVLVTYDYGGNRLFKELILIPYYGRLLALNTWEGSSTATLSNFYARCRFSQIGNPLNSIMTGYVVGDVVNLDSWRSDVFGKGGFIDAPVNEQIVSATFFKNTLIVFFERSTWQLRYQGEYGIPFIWERISSDFGSESTFSSILFDEGVLSVGNRAIVSSSGNSVQRIDLDIPDKVFEFQNILQGNKRVFGARNFQKELVYWSYADPQNQNKFPNRVLVYNYRNNTFAEFRENITCFGQIYSPNGITWDSETVTWDDAVSWDDFEQEQFEIVCCGNQQGFVHFYGYPDINTTANSLVNALDQESLAISSITIASTTELEVINHNLEDTEIIYIVGCKFLDGFTPDASPSINNRIFMVEVIDSDNIKIFLWNQSVSGYEEFTDPGTGEYIGGGRIALFRIPDITTKDFNPYKNRGMNFKTSYLDVLADATPNSAISINYILNASMVQSGNALIGQQELEMSLGKMGFVYDATNANPCVITSPNHGLVNGSQIFFSNLQGMTQLNGQTANVTYLTSDTFSIDIDSTAFGTYSNAGDWAEVLSQFYIPESNYAWHRFFASCFGQYIALNFTYDEFLKNQISTHQQLFEINALQLWCRSGGSNIFGK